MSEQPREGAAAEVAASAKDLTKTYGKGEAEVRALDGVTVDLMKGEFTAVMGPSGSGKSTLMHCLAALDTPTSGEAIVDGTSLGRLKDKDLTTLRRERVGFVFQSFNLVPTLSAEENILLPLSLAGRKPDREWFDQVVDSVGLRPRLGHRPSEMSGGQQQRVACARALVSKPSIVFADEPTGNLDSTSSGEVLGFLRRSVDEFGQTVVMVTHDPVAASYTDRIVFLADGKIVDELRKPDRDADPREDGSPAGRRGAEGGRLMLRLTWRNLLARKVRLLMSTLAIVLGIGFLAGVMTFSTGLNSTFDNIVEGSTPDAQVRPAGDVQGANSGVGTTSLITPADVEKLAALPEVADAAGSVDGLGSFLLGKDDKLVGGQGAPTLAFNYAPSENIQGEQVLQLVQGGWPEKPGEVTLDASSAERGGYSLGDTVTMITPTAQPRRTFTLVGTAEFNGGGTAGATLVLLDTKESQDIFLDGKDAFTSVSLTAADGVSRTELADAAKKVVPDGFTAVTGDKVIKEQQDQIGQFLDVISIFLTTFAVIAIVVGAFIIFNTFSILVSQRVRESALLRALGASKKQVTRSVLIEAFLMSVVGATLGLLLGLGLSRALAGLFRTFGLDIAGDVLTLTTFTIVSGYVVGILVTMVAAFVPARRAAKVPPVAAMRDDLVVQEKGMGRRLLLGTIAMVVGTALVAAGLVGAPGTDAIWIGAGAVIWVVTTAVLAPVVGKPVLLLCRSLFGRLFGTAGTPGRGERPAQPAAYGRHRLRADDRPGRRLGRRRARLVAQRHPGQDRRRPVHQRLPRPAADVPGLPDAVRRQDGAGRRRRGGLAPAGRAGQRRGRRQARPDVRQRRRRGLHRRLHADDGLRRRRPVG